VSNQKINSTHCDESEKAQLLLWLPTMAVPGAQQIKKYTSKQYAGKYMAEISNLI